MPVSKTSASTFQKDFLLAIFSDVHQVFTCLCVINNSSTRHLDDLVITVGTKTSTMASAHTVTSEDMTIVFEVKQSPIILARTDDDVSATSAVATIRSTLRSELFTMKVSRTAAASTASDMNLYVIYEIAICHSVSNFCKINQFLHLFAKIGYYKYVHD